MGKLTAAGQEMATQAITAAFTAVGQTSAAACFQGWYNLFVGGTFVGSVGLEASFDGGMTWLPVTSLGNAVAITGRAVELLRQFEPGVLIRARCIAFTSGTIEVRISQ